MFGQLCLINDYEILACLELRKRSDKGICLKGLQLLERIDVGEAKPLLAVLTWLTSYHFLLVRVQLGAALCVLISCNFELSSNKKDYYHGGLLVQHF